MNGSLSEDLRSFTESKCTLFQSIARVLRTAWGAWRYRVSYSKIARKALGRLAFKAQSDVISRWREVASTRKANRDKVRRVLGKILNRALAESFTAWVERVKDKKKLVRHVIHG